MSIVEMLFCTSLVALVGSGATPTSSPRTLQIVNTKRQSTICELRFPTAILAVRMNRKRLVVVLEAEIYIYDISTMKLLQTLEPGSNPNGESQFLRAKLISTHHPPCQPSAHSHLRMKTLTSHIRPNLPLDTRPCPLRSLPSHHQAHTPAPSPSTTPSRSRPLPSSRLTNHLSRLWLSIAKARCLPPLQTRVRSFAFFHCRMVRRWANIGEVQNLQGFIASISTRLERFSRCRVIPRRFTFTTCLMAMVQRAREVASRTGLAASQVPTICHRLPCRHQAIHCHLEAEDTARTPHRRLPLSHDDPFISARTSH